MPVAAFLIDAATACPASIEICLPARSEGSCDTVDKDAKKSLSLFAIVACDGRKTCSSFSSIKVWDVANERLEEAFCN